jgi:hypothetical protein
MVAIQEKDSFEGIVLLTALITPYLAPQNPNRHEIQELYTGISATVSQKTHVNYGEFNFSTLFMIFQFSVRNS